MMKRIVLCADDYGQAPGISRGIVSLLEKGRLSATSCLVNGLGWQEQAQWLKPFASQADVGLHVNLTEGKPLSRAFTTTYGDSLFSLSALMARAACRRLDKSVIEAELVAQVERFSEVMGSLPRFLDGHQHVHQFTIVREALFAVYERFLRPGQVYIRWVNPKRYPLDLIYNFKKAVICMMGTADFGRDLQQKQIPHNTSFAGIYAFQGAYEAQFPRFLTEVEDGGIIMCHPSLSDDGDPIAKARLAEYRYLAGSEFEAACAHFKAKIGRFSQRL